MEMYGALAVCKSICPIKPLWLIIESLLVFYYKDQYVKNENLLSLILRYYKSNISSNFASVLTKTTRVSQHMPITRKFKCHIMILKVGLGDTYDWYIVSFDNSKYIMY